MRLDNPWFLTALLGVLGWFHIKLVADFLNLSRLPATVPEPLKDKVTGDDLQRIGSYVSQRTKLGVMEDAISLACLIGFWWSGGFGWLEGWTAGFGLGVIPSGLLLFGVLGLASALLSLPFDWFSTFRIESEFGLNRTSPATFIADRVKGLIVGAVLGGILAAAVLWLFEHVVVAAFWAWLVTALFGLLMTWLAPMFLMPLFMKFTPMADSELKTAILDLARRLQFPVQDLYVVDGSRRSTKANAFFTGLGSSRRIALFDTLIESHSKDEILAVLAHEIGHAKLGHVPKMLVTGLVQSAVMFGCLHFAVRDPGLFAAFGVGYGSVAMGLVLFMIVWKPWSVLLDVLHGTQSRRHEFVADAFSREACGDGGPLISALSRLSKDHLSHLTPHPFYVQLHYSHPPVVERLEALRR